MQGSVVPNLVGILMPSYPEATSGNTRITVSNWIGSPKLADCQALMDQHQ